MRKIKKIVLVIIVAVLCCSCTKTTEEINQAGTDSAQGDEIVNLQEVIQNMKSDNTHIHANTCSNGRTDSDQ